ncbi:MAG: hypothetical protein JRI53_02270 [Deltaproteobacteria bacterium]|nr:hypothetical protein [Deltaproteobacteria bacterium]MBW1983518.1 hypothetical protein [Deltaproteobacteria bacterium]
MSGFWVIEEIQSYIQMEKNRIETVPGKRWANQTLRNSGTLVRQDLETG